MSASSPAPEAVAAAAVPALAHAPAPAALAAPASAAGVDAATVGIPRTEMSFPCILQVRLGQR